MSDDNDEETELQPINDDDAEPANHHYKVSIFEDNKNYNQQQKDQMVGDLIGDDKDDESDATSSSSSSQQEFESELEEQKASNVPPHVKPNSNAHRVKLREDNEGHAPPPNIPQNEHLNFDDEKANNPYLDNQTMSGCQPFSPNKNEEFIRSHSPIHHQMNNYNIHMNESDSYESSPIQKEIDDVEIETDEKVQMEEQISEINTSEQDDDIIDALPAKDQMKGLKERIFEQILNKMDVSDIRIEMDKYDKLYKHSNESDNEDDEDENDWNDFRNQDDFNILEFSFNAQHFPMTQFLLDEKKLSALINGRHLIYNILEQIQSQPTVKYSAYIDYTSLHICVWILE